MTCWTRLQAIVAREQRAYVGDHIAFASVLALVGYLIATFAY